MSREPNLNSTQLLFGVHRLDRVQVPSDFPVITIFMIELASPGDTEHN
jgi:hypothetical protein